MHHGLMCGNIISSMVFAVRPWLLLENQLAFETRLLLEKIWYFIYQNIMFSRCMAILYNRGFADPVGHESTMK